MSVQNDHFPIGSLIHIWFPVNDRVNWRKIINFNDYEFDDDYYTYNAMITGHFQKKQALQEPQTVFANIHKRLLSSDPDGDYKMLYRIVFLTNDSEVKDTYTNLTHPMMNNEYWIYDTEFKIKPKEIPRSPLNND